MRHCTCKHHPPEFSRDLPESLMLRSRKTVCRWCSQRFCQITPGRADPTSPQGVSYRWLSARSLYTRPYPGHPKPSLYTITKEDYTRIVQSPEGCFYGGMREGEILPNGNILCLGLERIDNAVGHTRENCVAACGRHNQLRGNVFTPEEVKAVLKAVPRMLLCGESTQQTGRKKGHDTKRKALLAELEKYRI